MNALEKRCSGMADRCEDLMGKYESMLRRTTQMEVSVGLMRSRFETRTLEERIESGRDWEQWLASVEDIEEEERLVAEAKETAKAWVDSLVGDVDIAPK